MDIAKRLLLILTMALTSMAGPAIAERPTQSINVRVLEPAGAGVPGAVVTLYPAQATGGCKFTKLADSEGRVVFEAVAAGEYDLRIELAGFFTQTLHDVPVALPNRGELPKEIRTTLTLGPIWY